MSTTRREVKVIKAVDALRLAKVHRTCTDDELDAALLAAKPVLEELNSSFKILFEEKQRRDSSKQLSARQMSLTFDDEIVSNSKTTLETVEEVTTVYSVDRDAVLAIAGVKSVKYGDYVESRAVVKEKEIIKQHIAGTLDPSFIPTVSSHETRQLKWTFGEEEKEEGSK